MAFTQATAVNELRTSEILSADNSIPERHIVIATLRNAAPRLGLSASVISTLDAMLSCLAPERNHHTVFASNSTLTFRRNGISDRTIRRHAAKLQELGLLIRRDSPNKKRFTKHSSTEGKALRFGFDLSPLFERLYEIASIAADVLREREQIDYLRAKIRAEANSSLTINPDDKTALDIMRMLRRKLSLHDCEKILSELPVTVLEGGTTDTQTYTQAANMAANDGQIVRHHHKSNKELNDKERTSSKKLDDLGQQDAPIGVVELLSACPEASQFALKKIETVHDVIAHARTLAPMIGITPQNYEAAHKRLGPLRTASTVWAIIQLGDKIKTIGAYFRSITTGPKSEGFSPERLIRRLALAQSSAI